MLCDPHVERVEARVDHLGGGRQRTIGVIGLLERRAEHGHDAVAHIGDQRAAGAEDRLGHLVQIGVDDLDHGRGGQLLGEAREPAQVGEQHRAVTFDGAEAQVVAGAGDDLLDDVGGHEAREQVVHACPFDRLAHVQHRERAECAEGERDERVDKRSDPAVVERDLDGDRERDRERRGAEQRAPLADPQAAERHDGAEDQHREDVDPAGDVAQRHAFEQRRCRVGPDFGPGHRAVARRRGVQVLEDR